MVANFGGSAGGSLIDRLLGLSGPACWGVLKVLGLHLDIGSG